MSFVAAIIGIALGGVAGYALPLLALHRARIRARPVIEGTRLRALVLLLPAAFLAFFVGIPWGGGGADQLLGTSGIAIGMLLGGALAAFIGTFVGALAGGALGSCWHLARRSR